MGGELDRARQYFSLFYALHLVPLLRGIFKHSYAPEIRAT